jgi:hypothetical protein
MATILLPQYDNAENGMFESTGQILDECYRAMVVMCSSHL